MALVYLYPVADDAVGGSVGSSGGAPHYTKVDEPFNQANDADEVFSTAAAQDGSGLIRYQLQAMPPVISVNSVTIVARVRRDAGTGHHCVLAWYSGGTYYYGTDTSPATTYEQKIHAMPTNPATGAAWTPADLATPRAAWEAWDLIGPLSSVYHSQLYLQVDCVLAPTALGMARDRHSRELRLYARPDGQVKLGNVPLGSFGGYGPLSDVAVSHVAFPPAGAGIQRWQRRLLVVTRTRLDLDELRLDLEAYDQRRLRLADWDTCYSPEDEPGSVARGVARLCQGGRTHTRGTVAWVPSPLDGRYIALGTEDSKISSSGQLVENQRTNYAPYSAFAAGLSGWTPSGTGSNGSAIATDAAETFFDLGIVPAGAVKFTSGSPIHAADLLVTGAASASVLANTVVCVSVAHRDLGGALWWKLQRGVDSWYWNDTTAAWQGLAVWNALPIRTSRARDRSKAINVGASNTTLTARVGVPTASGVAGQLNWCGLVQVEDSSYPTSPIVTTSATAVTRNRDVLTLTCNHGQRTLPMRGFSARFRIRPLWNDADITGVPRVFFDFTIDSGNNMRMAYTGGQGALWQRRFGGVNYATLGPGSLWVADQEYRVALRATGPEGELGLAPYTLSIFVDGVKGTDVVAPGYFAAPPAQATLRIGSLSSPTTFGADASFAWREIIPWVLPDDELVDF